MDENPINQLKKIEVDENGLIKGIPYKFTEEGLIDWRAMVNSKYLYVNPTPKFKEKIEKKYGKIYSELNPSEDNIEDSDLVILLAGIKYLLRLRQYHSVEYIIKESNQEFAAVNCIIKFAPNYESLGKEIIFSDCACASVANTNGFGNNYLLEMATNRSLARCVRSFLNINIVSKEEMNSNIEVAQEKSSFLSDGKQVELLKTVMETRIPKVTWQNIKEKLSLEGRFDESWKSIDKLPKDIIFELISRLKKKPETAKEKPVEPEKIETT